MDNQFLYILSRYRNGDSFAEKCYVRLSEEFANKLFKDLSVNAPIQRINKFTNDDLRELFNSISWNIDQSYSYELERVMISDEFKIQSSETLSKNSHPVFLIVMFLLGFMIAGYRPFIVGHVLSLDGAYEAVAHLVFGTLLGGWIYSKNRLLLCMMVMMAVVELICFFSK